MPEDIGSVNQVVLMRGMGVKDVSVGSKGLIWK
jgi:hypothetical protein